MDNPGVRECPRRTECCHASCEDYAAYAAWCDQRRQERQKRARDEDALNHGKRRRYAMCAYREKHKKA